MLFVSHKSRTKQQTAKMSIAITILGSGSKGNAILLHDKDWGLLVDAGFSRKETWARLNVCGIQPGIIKALLITHEHEDHVKGCRLIAQDLDIPVYGTPDTIRHLSTKNAIGPKKFLFDPGTRFQLGPFQVEPFTVPHDALQPVGFIISDGHVKIGIATDLGQLNRLCRERLSGCDALILESNHDLQMLRDAERPLHLKRRILGSHGHLNNDDALHALEELLKENTKFLFLAHLSTDCNCPDLVHKLALGKLTNMGRTDILLKVAGQSCPLPTVRVGH
ncbi:MAG: hypothetical protein A2X49_15790 [Lentisphaerae bacterium GWF2_52_8]|nr:MAG: hypothetical protein A2X49_15790 [Lentisphaerae bacterium GWF2_52_8]